jgi:hypothetical protein
LVVNVREGIFGLEHLRLAACRQLFNMKADAFVKRFAGLAVPVEVCLDASGNPINCERCGFVMVRATFANGWHTEMCSALPLVDLEKPAFCDWLTSLAGKKLDCQKDGCQTADLEPILHDK